MASLSAGTKHSPAVKIQEEHYFTIKKGIMHYYFKDIYHAGDEGPHLAMTGESRGCSRAAAPVCCFSRGTTARSMSLSWGAREVGSPCEWRGRHVCLGHVLSAWAVTVVLTLITWVSVRGLHHEVTFFFPFCAVPSGSKSLFTAHT